MVPANVSSGISIFMVVKVAGRARAVYMMGKSMGVISVSVIT